MGRGLKLDRRARTRPVGLESSLKSGGKGGAFEFDVPVVTGGTAWAFSFTLWILRVTRE